MFTVDFVPAAARQVAAARDWWLANREKAPTAFDEDLADLMELLAETPLSAGARVGQRPGVRKVLLRRVRYHVYFTIDESSVTILAVWHASRGTGPL